VVLAGSVVVVPVGPDDEGSGTLAPAQVYNAAELGGEEIATLVTGDELFSV
jgi:hypothetical protein